MQALEVLALTSSLVLIRGQLELGREAGEMFRRDRLTHDGGEVKCVEGHGDTCPTTNTDQTEVGGNFDFNWDSVDSVTYNTGTDPPTSKISSKSREEAEKKACPDDWALFNPGPGKKKLCLINRYSYKDKLKAPVYPCDSLTSPSPQHSVDHVTLQPVFGPCRADGWNGTKGESNKLSK